MEPNDATAEPQQAQADPRAGELLVTQLRNFITQKEMVIVSCFQASRPDKDTTLTQHARTLQSVVDEVAEMVKTYERNAKPKDSPWTLEEQKARGMKL